MGKAQEYLSVNELDRIARELLVNPKGRARRAESFRELPLPRREHAGRRLLVHAGGRLLPLLFLRERRGHHRHFLLR